MGLRLRVSDRCCFARLVGSIEVIQASQCLAKMAVIEAAKVNHPLKICIGRQVDSRIGVHLHEDGKQMQGKEDLSRPTPVAHERISLYTLVRVRIEEVENYIRSPERKPDHLVYALNRHTKIAPA